MVKILLWLTTSELKLPPMTCRSYNARHCTRRYKTAWTIWTLSGHVLALGWVRLVERKKSEQSQSIFSKQVRNANSYQCDCSCELNKDNKHIESLDNNSKEEMNSTGIAFYFPTKIWTPGHELLSSFLPSLSFHLYSMQEVPGNVAESRVSEQPVSLCPSVAIKLLQLSIYQKDRDRRDRLSLAHQRAVAMAISCCQVACN